MLKGHGNEVDFLGFCINQFGIGPLHYVSSSFDFGFEFAEIFIIEKRLPDLPSRGVNKIAYRYNFFKPLNKSMVIVHYISGFFFAKLIF
jgi:hypothetical protein